MSKVFSSHVTVGPLRQGPESQQFQKPFDPHRMPELEKVVAPVNTRCFLYHSDLTKDPRGEGIVIEGKGATDQERIADFSARLADKQKLGWSTERQQDGTHPHSNDTQRVEMQTLAAERGDKAAASALAAKSSRKAVPVSAEDLKVKNELMAVEKELADERIARLEAEKTALAARLDALEAKINKK